MALNQSWSKCLFNISDQKITYVLQSKLVSCCDLRAKMNPNYCLIS